MTKISDLFTSEQLSCMTPYAIEIATATAAEINARCEAACIESRTQLEMDATLEWMEFDDNTNDFCAERFAIDTECIEQAAMDVEVHSAEKSKSRTNEVIAIDNAIMKIGVSHPDDDWARVARDMASTIDRIGVRNVCEPMDKGDFKNYFFGVIANYCRDFADCVELIDAIAEFSALCRASSEEALTIALGTLAEDVLGIASRTPFTAKPSTPTLLQLFDKIETRLNMLNYFGNGTTFDELLSIEYMRNHAERWNSSWTMQEEGKAKHELFMQAFKSADEGEINEFFVDLQTILFVEATTSCNQRNHEARTEALNKLDALRAEEARILALDPEAASLARAHVAEQRRLKHKAWNDSKPADWLPYWSNKGLRPFFYISTKDSSDYPQSRT